MRNRVMHYAAIDPTTLSGTFKFFFQKVSGPVYIKRKIVSVRAYPFFILVQKFGAPSLAT